jgi:hypothetical protein
MKYCNEKGRVEEEFKGDELEKYLFNIYRLQGPYQILVF